MDKTIRDLVPSQLAQWLDAYSVEGEEDFGRPGFEELRLAWTGRIPPTEACARVDEWVLGQKMHQDAAQSAYERLFEMEPILSDETGEIVVPAWFATWWGEVLVSQPWDESLERAVAEATEYADWLQGRSPAASIKQPIGDAGDDGDDDGEQG